MPILLTLTRKPRNGRVEPGSLLVREEGAVLGRSGSCDIIIHDESRTVSGQHARLAWEIGEFRLYDSSTNGTFLNGDPERIPRGVGRAVGIGDHIRLGDFEFAIDASPDPDELTVTPWKQSDSEPERKLTAATPTEPDTLQAGRPASATQPENVDALPNNSEWLDSGQFLSGFLRGAGLDTTILAKRDSAALGEQFGLVLRDAITTVMLALRYRAESKNEFRLSSTQVMAQGNNALKFSVDATEALGRLFGAFQGAYLNAESSLAEAQRDIRKHELASMYGTSVAIVELLSRFDPRQLEHDLQESLKVPFWRNRAAELWNRYHALYDELTGMEFELVHDEFARVFAAAYTDKARELSEE